LARVLRGGSWMFNPEMCRAACRLYRVEPALGYGNFGCRVVMCLD
jgi:hypothetical protein